MGWLEKLIQFFPLKISIDDIAMGGESTAKKC